MAAVGCTLMCEQTPPKEPVEYAVRAEEAGFDLAVMSDHYYPWLYSQRHSPHAWSVLGAVAHATSRMDLMSFVTCPIRRYHPAPADRRPDGRRGVGPVVSRARRRVRRRRGRRRAGPERAPALRRGGRRGQAAVRAGRDLLGPDEAECRKIVHDQWRRCGLGWKANAELPGPDSANGRSPSCCRGFTTGEPRTAGG